MAISGLRTTLDFVEGARPKNWREGVLKLYPNGSAPLFALSAGMKERQVDDPEFYWWEEEMQTHRFELAGNLSGSSGVQTVTVTSANSTLKLKEGDILLVEHTLELLFVVADPTNPTQVVVQRGWGGSSVAAVTYNGVDVNPNIRVVGSAYEEGSMPPTGKSYDPAKRYNYTQIFRDTLEITRTAMNTRLRTGDEVKRAKAECLEKHSRDIEMSFLFGKRSETTKNGKPLRTMDGVINQIDPANIVSGVGALDMETWEEYAPILFGYGSEEKVAFIGNRTAIAINQMVRKNSSFEIQTGIKEYGMAVARLITPLGTLVMKRHPLLNQSGGGENAGSNAYYGLDSWMIVLDMKNLTYVELKGGATKYQADLQANGMDGMQSGYLSEVSLEVHHPKTHALLKGITSGIEDS